MQNRKPRKQRLRTHFDKADQKYKRAKFVQKIQQEREARTKEEEERRKKETEGLEKVARLKEKLERGELVNVEQRLAEAKKEREVRTLTLITATRTLTQTLAQTPESCSTYAVICSCNDATAAVQHI